MISNVLAHNLTLVTHSVNGLQVEDWEVEV
jgi:hypothetical protein